MLRYISLCVEQRKGRLAKDGLHQYRMSCQSLNLSSLEVVVKHFLNEANERAQEAQSKADKITLDIEDLEAEESPESLILGSVSGEDSKDRTDREVVTPWLKFLWETYRTVLEVLRNNLKLENVYQTTAQQAFTFCVRYKRNTEFRRLCDLLRSHLASVGKHPTGVQGINLTQGESLLLHVNTRFGQLSAAVELELWQEAFRALQEIHGLLTTHKKIPKPSIGLEYYQRLAQLFWESSNPLFHAAALHRLWALSKAHGKLTEEEQRVLASQVLLATMAVPRGDHEGYEEAQLERQYRLANLLSFGALALPKRAQLVEELSARGILSQVVPELQDFYEWMEVKFHPLQFIAVMRPKLEYLASHPNLKQYAQPLQARLLVRLLQQLARVYETLKISEFLKLASFGSFHEIEKALVDAVKEKYVDVRVDHQEGVLNFKTQSLEGEQLRDQLTLLSHHLHCALEKVHPRPPEELKRNFFAQVAAELQEEHQRVLGRKLIIERRKEEEEVRRKHRQALEDQRRREEQQRRKEEEEARQLRAMQAMEEAEQQRAQKEKARIEVEQWLLSAGQEVSQEKIKEILDQMKGPADIQSYIQKRIDEVEKEKKKVHLKLKKVKKDVDFFERAKREEELPLLRAQWEKQREEEKENYETSKEEFLRRHKQAHLRNVEEKARLAHMQPARAAFEAK